MEYLGYEYVDLGLPSGLKWATMNVGANSVTDYGLYFQWGDTQGYTASLVGRGEGQKYFGWADYKYGNGTTDPGATGMTKYNSTDGKTVLEAIDDAVTAAWGGSWRMPTETEFNELIANTTSEWTTIGGVDGRKFTATNGNYVFFPSAGYCSSGIIGGLGFYWSSSRGSNVVKGRYLNFGSGYYETGGNDRRGGSVIRGVFTIEVPKEDLTREELNYSSNAAVVYEENQYTLPVLTNTHSLSLTYNSSDTNVATINSNGIVSIVGNGTTTITASFAGDDEYNAKTINYVLIVDIKKYLDYKGLETFKQQLDIEFNKKANSSTVQGIIDDIGDNSTLNSVKGRIKVIEDKIPSAASSDNQLADKNFVNSSVATNTATYKGNYNVVSDLELSYNSTHLEIAQALALEISLADNNDYCFVLIPTSNSSYEEIKVIERYKFDGINWNYEYSLNNSGFTSNLWKAINSGITSELITIFNNKYDKPSGGIPKTDLSSTVQSSLDKADTALQLHQDISGKADKTATVSDVAYDGTNKKITKTINGTTSDVVTVSTIKTDLNLSKSDIGLDNVVNTGDSATPISGGTTKFTTGGAYIELNKKVDKIEGKSLSTNDYTTEEKNKLSSIESGAQTHKAPTAAEVKSALGTGSGTSKYLREDGTWQTPPDTNTWRPVSDSVSSTDSSTSASSKAVKTAYDLAASKTSNTGTVTSVAVKMNGSVKGTVTTNGTIDLGTIITSHQDISDKADKSTTLSGYGITDAYTKTEIDNIITDNELVVSSALNDLNENKADKSTVYTKTEIDNMIGNIETLLAAI